MTKTRILLLSLLALSIAALSSCLGVLCVNGNGIIRSEERDMIDFVEIINSTSADIIFEVGDEFSVVVEADANLLQYLVTTVRSNTLEIETKGVSCIRPTANATVYIIAPELESCKSTGSGDFIGDDMLAEKVWLKNTGSGDIFVDYIEADDIDITMTGSGDILVYDSYSENIEVTISGSGDNTISGQSDNATFTSTGSGENHAGDLDLLTADVLITGSGDIYTWVRNELIAKLTGSGNLYYTGDPDITSTVTGSGRIISAK
jgi:hypothetical protein